MEKETKTLTFYYISKNTIDGRFLWLFSWFWCHYEISVVKIVRNGRTMHQASYNQEGLGEEDDQKRDGSAFKESERNNC